jgi:hypothetical protein
MQESISDVCATHDSDLDGYLSVSEFRDLKRDDKTFMTTDVNRDGRLHMKECERGLGS